MGGIIAVGLSNRGKIPEVAQKIRRTVLEGVDVSPHTFFRASVRQANCCIRRSIVLLFSVVFSCKMDWDGM